MDDAEELDRLVRRDLELAARIAPHERVKAARLKSCAARERQAEAVFERDAGEILKERERGRARILAIWKERHDAETSLDLPSAKVSRRNYAELKILNRNLLYDALDRADRLDLVRPKFDEKAVLELVREGKLRCSEGAVHVLNKFNLQVRPRKENADAEVPG